jgi:hypothetical protein
MEKVSRVETVQEIIEEMGESAGNADNTGAAGPENGNPRSGNV